MLQTCVRFLHFLTLTRVETARHLLSMLTHLLCTVAANTLAALVATIAVLDWLFSYLPFPEAVRCASRTSCKTLSRILTILSTIVSAPISTTLSGNSKTKPRSQKTVAVVGGGIAGTACAWSLASSNSVQRVVLFEQRDVLGGNAKTFEWHLQREVGKEQRNAPTSVPVRTGLSVLAWPQAYFKNYTLLLEHLKLPTVDVVPKFYVSADGVTPTYCQGEPLGNEQWHDDQVRWDRCVRCVRRVNECCFTVSEKLKRATRLIVGLCLGRGAATPSARGSAPRDTTMPSMYEVTLWNPMNIIPARLLCQRVFGVSDGFWYHVVVPVYSSSFLTSALNQMPSVILPPLDDIISVGIADPLKTLKTWAGSSKDVFDAMADVIGHDNIVLGARIIRVYQTPAAEDSPTATRWAVEYIPNSPSNLSSDDGVTPALANNSATLFFDDVVFACPATAVDALTKTSSTLPESSEGAVATDCIFRDALFESIIPNVRYENERDDNFLEGVVHSDRAAAIPNAAMREDVLTKGFTNYIELIGNPADGRLENSFVLGTWVPAALSAVKESPAVPEATAPQFRNTQRHQQHRHQQRKRGAATGARSAPPYSNTQVGVDGVADMYVTYQPAAHQRSAVRSATLALVDNSWAHPQFTMQSLGLSMALPLLQGRHGAYYCASYTTPGNGHDLSFLSGLAVAYTLSGGYYPFEGTASSAARRDFELLKGLLLWE